MKKNKKNYSPSLTPEQKPFFEKSAYIINIIFILLIVLILFSAYLFIKVRNLEQRIAEGVKINQDQQNSPLSVDNLKKYAKELGLNAGKFNKCLDSGEKKSLVDADLKYGASLGVQGTPGIFVNGRFFAGAFPFEFFDEVIKKEIAGTASDNCSDYSENLQKYCQDEQNKAFNPVSKKIDLGKSPSEGASKPKVTIVEFSDFQCPFCGRANTTLKKILNTYPNEVRLYFKQYPLSNIHPQAQKAAEGSLCALDQGQDKFWKYHNKLFDLQSQGQN